MLSDEQISDIHRQADLYFCGNTNRLWAAKAIESAACAERDARIAELEQQLAEERKDAERWAYVANHWSNAQFHWNRDQTFKSVVMTIKAAHQGGASAAAALAKEVDAAIKEQA